MKKWISMILCLLAVLYFSLPVLATGEISTTDEPPDEDEVIVVYDWGTGQPVKQSNGVNNAQGGAIPGLFAIDMRMETVGDVPYITRYYELESELSLAEIPQGFEQDGYRFYRHDVLCKETPATAETKAAHKTEVFTCEKNDVARLMESAPEEITYNENGFSGVLYPDIASIRFEEGGRSSYKYTVSEVREYPGLASNDAAYIDKSISKNGVDLQLEGIEWQVMAQTPVDGGMVPSQYKGIASYSGRATGSKVSSYTAYVSYSGEVSKTTPGKLSYAVIYRGEVIPESVPVIEIEETLEVPTKSYTWLYCLLFAVLISGLIAFIFIKRDAIYTLFCKADVKVEEQEPADELAGPVQEEKQVKAEATAANILAAIEGIDEASPPKIRRKSAAKKEQIPLVEKIEENN